MSTDIDFLFTSCLFDLSAETFKNCRNENWVCAVLENDFNGINVSDWGNINILLHIAQFSTQRETARNKLRAYVQHYNEE